jgi:hypothetical protein
MKFCITFCITFCMYIQTYAAEKTYEVVDAKEVQKVLQETSCFWLIFHGYNQYHPVMSAIMTGWHIGKLEVTDDDTQSFIWLEDAKEYRIKRTLKIFLYDQKDTSKLTLKTKPCGAFPIQEPDQHYSVWDEEKK